jgi:hypothetical protein
MGKQKANGLRRFIEGSPLITLCAATIAMAGTVFGALNWLYSSKYGVEVAILKRQYSDKIKQLDDERSRIKFTVKDQSSFLDLKTLLVNEEQLGTEYKKFRVAGFADFAVPISASATVAWTWKETNQFDMISEMLGQTLLSELFPDPQLKEVFRRGVVQSFESPTLVEVDAPAGKMKLKARCFFQALTKTDLDHIFTAAETKEKDSKEDSGNSRYGFLLFYVIPWSV